jgi:3-hydroxyisobutyrate dehydrogenase-like beta-hydroxyacid dehydrogenase
MSTVSPRLSRDLAARATAKGAEMLESPVSGSVPAVEAGTLVASVGGPAEALERVRPILEKLSQRIVHVGGNGQGVTMKISINLSLAAQLLSLYEGLLLAERSGLPRQAALEAMLNSVIASPAMKYRAPLGSASRACRRTCNWPWNSAVKWECRSSTWAYRTKC